MSSPLRQALFIYAVRKEGVPEPKTFGAKIAIAK
jgi:hypothetical protein